MLTLVREAECHSLPDFPQSAARLPGSSPPSLLPRERRDVPHRKAVVWRVRREFEEMPGLLLTAEQATRLFGLQAGISRRILEELVEKHVLHLTRTKMYGLQSSPP
jgi:hypothetical protein